MIISKFWDLKYILKVDFYKEAESYKHYNEKWLLKIKIMTYVRKFFWKSKFQLRDKILINTFIFKRELFPKTPCNVLIHSSSLPQDSVCSLTAPWKFYPLIKFHQKIASSGPACLANNLQRRLVKYQWLAISPPKVTWGIRLIHTWWLGDWFINLWICICNNANKSYTSLWLYLYFICFFLGINMRCYALWKRSNLYAR